MASDSKRRRLRSEGSLIDLDLISLDRFNGQTGPLFNRVVALKGESDDSLLISFDEITSATHSKHSSLPSGVICCNSQGDYDSYRDDPLMPWPFSRTCLHTVLLMLFVIFLVVGVALTCLGAMNYGDGSAATTAFKVFGGIALIFCVAFLASACMVVSECCPCDTRSNIQQGYFALNTAAIPKHERQFSESNHASGILEDSAVAVLPVVCAPFAMPKLSKPQRRLSSLSFSRTFYEDQFEPSYTQLGSSPSQMNGMKDNENKRDGDDVNDVEADWV